MNRRLVGLGVAAALALVGTLALVGYVASAERRALAGEELVQVYVVAAPVPVGTAGEDLVGYVTAEQVPVKVRALGAVTDLGSLTGQVAAVDLVVGEQLVAGRFAEQSGVSSREAGVEVPEGAMEVTIEIDPQRAVGGLIQPGSTVAVFATYDPFNQGQAVIPFEDGSIPLPSSAPVEGDAESTTEVLLRKALITAVQEPSGRPDETQRLSTSPGGSLLVTFAVDPFDAERLVFTAEFGRIWLAIERETVPDDQPPGQTRGSVMVGQADRP